MPLTKGPRRRNQPLPQTLLMISSSRIPSSILGLWMMYSWKKSEKTYDMLKRITNGTLFHEHVIGVIDMKLKKLGHAYPCFYTDPNATIRDLNDMGNTVEIIVESIVVNTTPLPSDAQQRMKELCKLLNIPFENLSLIEKNFMFNVVTTTTHEDLLSLFFKNRHLCSMSNIQKWTNIHLLFLAFSLHTEFLHGYNNAREDFSAEADYEEHRLMVYVEMMKFYAECVKCGVFQHRHRPVSYEPLVYLRR